MISLDALAESIIYTFCVVCISIIFGVIIAFSLIIYPAIGAAVFGSAFVWAILYKALK
jgi:ABC-type Fe3+ transport system permease subunit